MANAKHADVEKMSYEIALKELEQIVGRLERGDVELEESIAMFERDDGKWAIDTNAHSGRSTAWTIQNPPAWLDAKSFTGWSVNTYGQNATISARGEDPLVLLRYRKGKTLPGGAHTVEMQPTDGFVFWIERVDDPQP